jgi:glutamyl-tRNA synthetase
LKWLEIDWDGDVTYQFGRAARHREVAEGLLAAGKAYYCYATPEELTAMRDKARAEGRTRLYDGLWRDRDPADAPAGIKPTIRLKAPQTGETVVDDEVRAAWSGRTRTSTISCCCAATASRPTCSRSWSTITTWASPT